MWTTNRETFHYNFRLKFADKKGSYAARDLIVNQAENKIDLTQLVTEHAELSGAMLSEMTIYNMIILGDDTSENITKLVW